MLVLEGGSLIDGHSDRPLRDPVVIIENNNIVGVGQMGHVTYAPDVRKIDTTGKTILPGLIDAHVHDCGDWAVRAYLHYGVTSVKDAGTVIDETIAQKQKIDSGAKVGARLFVTGPIVDGKPASYPGVSLEIDNAQEANAKISDLIEKYLLDGILIAQRIGPERLSAIVELAHKHGIHVSGQTWRISGQQAAELGIDGLENTSRLPETILTDDPALTQFDDVPGIGERIGRLARLWSSADEQKLDALIDLMVRHHVYWIPTLIMFQQLNLLRSQEHHRMTLLDGVPLPYLEMWENEQRYSQWDDVAFHNLNTMIVEMQRFTHAFLKAGGVVVAGTDNPNPYVVPGLSLHQELELLVAGGLTPMQAIRAATSSAAKFLGKRADRLGVIAPGNIADVLVVDGDPLTDIRFTRAVSTVIKDGEVIDHLHLLDENS